MTPSDLRSSPYTLPLQPPALDDLQSREKQLELQHLREAMSVLKHTRDEHVEVYDSAPVPLLTLDSSGAILRANLATARLLEVEKTCLLGRSLRSFVAPMDGWRLTQQLQQQAGTSCDVRLVLASGTQVPVRLAVTRFGSEATTLLNVAILDQSEQQRLRQENNQLLAATKQAQHANESKDQFIAMLSHELRTPLTPILAAASALKESPDVPCALRIVFERIADQAMAEARLVDDLLDANGILRGKMSVQREPLDLMALLRECVEMVRPLADAKQHTLDVGLSDEEQYVFGDAVRLRQVFVNLLRNAIKYTPDAGRIAVSSSVRSGRVVIDIEDNGIGFERSAISRLFDPFDQLSDAHAPRGGLGLGLAISRGLVELHEGGIEATSRGPGLGARFAVELPTTDERPAPPRSERMAPLSERRPITRSAVRILIVEDQPDAAEIFAEMFTRQGYKVVVAGSIAAALAVPSESFDVVVSDLGLPDGMGTELIQKLHAIRRRPAIALSGFGMAADVHAAKRAGFDMHLTKPVDMAKLMSALEHLLQSRAS